MPVQYGGDRITFSDGSNLGSGWTGFKNRIINGAMTIDQRNAGAVVTINSSNTFAYCPDRFQTNQGGSGVVFSSQQVSDAPTGFVNSLRVTVSTAATPSAGQFVFCRQIIEGFNIADLGWGTASAQTVTASFWVKSSITGAYAVFFINSAEDRSYFSTVTINSANTWEFKTVTVPGDTTGTWLTNNSNGIRFGIDLGSGSNYQGTVNAWQSGWKQRTAGTVNFCQNTGATFQITGVQLEKGSTATSFDYRPYGTELALCRRYFKWMPALHGNFVQGLNIFIAGAADVATTMRATPTGTIVNGTNGIHVSNVATYNITGINDINDNYFRVNTNSQPGSNFPGHYNNNAVSLNAEL